MYIDPFAPTADDNVQNSMAFSRNVICCFIRGVENFPIDPELYKLNEALKHIFNTRISVIKGLLSGYRLAPTLQQTINLPSKPTVYIRDLYGRPIEMVFNEWQKLIDEQLKIDVRYCSIELIFIEPDATHMHAMKAWHCTKTMPSSFSYEAKRDLSKPPEPLTHMLELHASIDTSEAALELAQAFLDEINSYAESESKPSEP